MPKWVAQFLSQSTQCRLCSSEQQQDISPLDTSPASQAFSAMEEAVLYRFGHLALSKQGFISSGEQTGLSQDWWHTAGGSSLVTGVSGRSAGRILQSCRFPFQLTPLASTGEETLPASLAACTPYTCWRPQVASCAGWRWFIFPLLHSHCRDPHPPHAAARTNMR